jgi:hypothetical protein
VNDLERELVELRERVSDSIRPSPSMAAAVVRRARIKRALTATAFAAIVALLALASIAGFKALETANPKSPAGQLHVNENNSTSPSLDFQPARGWNVRTTDPSLVPDLGTQAWASNVPFPQDEEPIGGTNVFPAGWPDKTERALPSDGILIVAAYTLQTRNPLPSTITDTPERTLPLTIDNPPAVQGEGQVPNRASTVINAIVHGRVLSVQIVFGTGNPDAALVREADSELANLIVAPPPKTTAALDDFGIRMDLPPEWTGRLFRYAASEPILHAATVPITDLYDGSSARKQLGPDDVFLVLSENYASAAHYEPVTLPVTIRPQDSCPTCEILDNGTTPQSDHSLFYRSFAVEGRQFDLYVEFGTTTPSSDQLARANNVLATLQIAPPQSPVPTESPGVLTVAPVSVDLPPGWIQKDDPVPGTSQSRVVVAYGTWDLPTGGDCGPEAALQDLPADGALVWVVEHASPGNAGDYTSLSPLFSIDLQTPPARWECASGAPSRMYLFVIGGRYLEVHLALGSTASDATIQRAETLIKSLHTKPAP